MGKFRRFFIFLSCTGVPLAFTQVTQADYSHDLIQNEQLLKHELEQQKRFQHKQYQRLVEKKAINGITNIATGFLEVPKNMINLINDEDNSNVYGVMGNNNSNIVYGFIGGGVKGIIDAVGRMTVGTFDLLTAPLPTQQVVYPKYVWDDFDKSNTYGKVFRLDESYKTAKPSTQPVAIVKPRLPVFDNAGQYSHEETNKRLNTIFENEMRK
jgi:putative exosortase-associated protein (TIGR04073 family)